MIVRRLVVGCAIACWAAGGAAQTLEQMPGYQRMRTASEEFGKLFQPAKVDEIGWSADGSGLLYQLNGEKKRLDLSTFKITPTHEQGVVRSATTRQASMMQWEAGVGRAEQRAEETSPDGHWKAVYQDFNVHLRLTDEGKAAGLNQEADIAVTSDGNERFRYGTGCWVYGEELYQSRAMWWSPDSRKLVFYEIDERHMKDYFLTVGNTDDYTQVQAVRYPIAGDANPRVSLWVYDVESRQKRRLEIPGEDMQYLYRISFAPAGGQLLVHRTNRRQNILDLLAIDVDTGAVTTVVTETQETFQNNVPTLRFLSDGERFLWETERSGWKHFELRHLDGRLLNPLSEVAEYPCEEIVLIDEDAGYFYYTAYSDHPLNQQLHRVRLDGSEHRQLTHLPYNFTSFFICPDHRWFVASYEAVDTPPVFALFDDQGEPRFEIARSDLSAAIAAGYSPPELFQFKADDGVTDIYGVLFKPTRFDANREYPLLIDVYGGPQSRGINNRFRALNPRCELGFVIATIGNRGTIGRGKAFESATYKRLGGPDMQDQADGVKYLRQRPYIDGERVGIFGHSYGGYMSALAVLKHPDVFHVAVAGAPVTDWRNYDTIYTERYMQTPQENSQGYDDGSCATYAGQLKGKLFLVHGLVDDNVHPTNTWKLAEALHKANVRFDMMVYPNFAHGIGSTYGSLIWEYLIKHLRPEPIE